MHKDHDFLRKIAPLGGKASGELQRGRAIKQYEAESPHCLYCKTPIPLVIPTTYRRNISTMSRRRFCDSSCAAKFRWAKIREQTGRPEPRRFKPWINTTPFKTLAEVAKCRQMINQHARQVYFASKPEGKCENCGIVDRDLIEVAHIKAIQTFSLDTQIYMINQLENLRGLCANCHKKFDRNLPGKKGNPKSKKAQPVTEAPIVNN